MSKYYITMRFGSQQCTMLSMYLLYRYFWKKNVTNFSFHSYVQWNEHSFLMAHLIGSGGRTHHASAFDPWQGIVPRGNMPAGNRALRAASPSPARSSGSSVLTDNEDSSSSEPTPRVEQNAVEVYRPNAAHAQQLEAGLNPQRLNGMVPERMFHQNVPAYALNFLHMFHEILQNPNNATANDGTDDSLEESELDDPPEENDENQPEGNDVN